ncbi:nucleotidyl transferase AbiEii/AbiGii toxin family protein [Asticcacaulis sp. YBE204]|uniref:nucleotidyl transferase AbiEii/AbiGii toxin family protein n=1 Tax=Asticcacaulis sp. YBE204 TaxID=1282363 RepID=UPI001F22B605|nr:nucleotidyl transferase AbiEii/AbiGii toxin family protein [Asticcacaulis sp. YBE204]
MRTIDPRDGGPPINVVVDFLMPRDAQIVKNKPPLVDDFAVQRADGADLALLFPEYVAISGNMPQGGTNRVEIAIASIPALLAMKGHAINGRHKQKDAYDVYYCVRNYPDGLEALAEACQPVLAHKSGAAGYVYIAGKFRELEDYGPTSVRLFVEDTAVLDGRTSDQWQQDAYGQVTAWLKLMGLA